MQRSPASWNSTAVRLSGWLRPALDGMISPPWRDSPLPGHDPLEVMRPWQEMGALLQVNAGSLTGHYNRSSPGSERLAWQMIEQGLVDLLATDHHGPRRRGVCPREARATLTARG